jgi:conjugal transfer mating pair stabilization protein TraN
MAYMEAAREAGVYLDLDKLTVFNGEGQTCRDRLLKNCCFTDGSGKGMTNQSTFGTGSKLVYDVLMNSENREFITAGLQALLTSGGFSGTFSTYGFTLAVNGSALPAGSTVLYSSSAVAGEGVVLAFDPWSLVIAIVIYVIMSLMECDEREGRLALQRGASLCHEVGSYCSHKVLGMCVTTTHSHCCFNSVLSRIINEQGRAQVGRGWGDARNPQCGGFTIAELQSLRFDVMDFSEFYASIVPVMPNVPGIQGNNTTRVPACYYGQGKC